MFYFTKLMILTICIIWFVKWLWSRRKLYIISWKMPGPFSLPFIGTGITLLSNENLTFMDKLTNTFKSPIRIWLGTKLFIYLDNVEDIETILTSPECINRDTSYQYMREALGVNGLFTLEGNQWRLHRKLVGPSFNYNAVIGYLPVFNRNSEILLEEIGSFVGKGIFDIRDLVKVTTLDSFLEATLGLDMNPNEKKLYGHWLAAGQAIVSTKIFRPWFHLDFIWNITKYPNLLKQCREFSKMIIGRVIDKKLKEGLTDSTFVDKMLRITERNKEFTVIDARAEATNALTAASDTSAWSIAFVILMLAIHQDCQEMVVDELKTVLSDDTEITRSHIEKLTYLEMCINETMRLFPIVSLMARKCEGNVKLRNYDISPGMNIAIAIREVHRKKEYWGSNVHDFNPENFLKSKVEQRNPYCFIPFSAGPRNCIGNIYAMVVLKTIVANIFRKYKFITHLKLNDLKVKMDINIVLLNGHMVQVYKRDV